MESRWNIFKRSKHKKDKKKKKGIEYHEGHHNTSSCGTSTCTNDKHGGVTGGSDPLYHAPHPTGYRASNLTSPPGRSPCTEALPAFSGRHSLSGPQNGSGNVILPVKNRTVAGYDGFNDLSSCSESVVAVTCLQRSRSQPSVSCASKRHCKDLEDVNRQSDGAKGNDKKGGFGTWLRKSLKRSKSKSDVNKKKVLLDGRDEEEYSGGAANWSRTKLTRSVSTSVVNSNQNPVGSLPLIPGGIVLMPGGRTGGQSDMTAFELKHDVTFRSLPASRPYILPLPPRPKHFSLSHTPSQAVEPTQQAAGRTGSMGLIRASQAFQSLSTSSTGSPVTTNLQPNNSQQVSKHGASISLSPPSAPVRQVSPTPAMTHPFTSGTDTMVNNFNRPPTLPRHNLAERKSTQGAVVRLESVSSGIREEITSPLSQGPCVPVEDSASRKIVVQQQHPAYLRPASCPGSPLSTDSSRCPSQSSDCPSSMAPPPPSKQVSSGPRGRTRTSSRGSSDQSTSLVHVGPASKMAHPRESSGSQNSPYPSLSLASSTVTSVGVRRGTLGLPPLPPKRHSLASTVSSITTAESVYHQIKDENITSRNYPGLPWRPPHSPAASRLDQPLLADDLGYEQSGFNGLRSSLHQAWPRSGGLLRAASHSVLDQAGSRRIPMYRHNPQFTDLDHVKSAIDLTSLHHEGINNNYQNKRSKPRDKVHTAFKNPAKRLHKSVSYHDVRPRKESALQKLAPALRTSHDNVTPPSQNVIARYGSQPEFGGPGIQSRESLAFKPLSHTTSEDTLSSCSSDSDLAVEERCRFPKRRRQRRPKRRAVSYDNIQEGNKWSENGLGRPDISGESSYMLQRWWATLDDIPTAVLRDGRAFSPRYSSSDSDVGERDGRFDFSI